ncbi:MAG: ferritin-like domain-containing protein [Myxococcales bacterium]|nr:MAG: ferritin-like domain-containing protein [Myxococcales bacterium]
MKYPQRNPLPLPASGPTEAIRSTFDSTFDWEYALDREELLSLYEKGKARSWNASDLDWSIDVDIVRMASEITDAGGHHVMNQLLDPPQTLTPEATVAMQLNMNAWMLSQFLHGEQGALVATAKLVMAAPLEEAKWYAANQVQDEARPVEVYHRYLTEKLGISFEVNRHLQVLLDDIISDSRWDMTYLGMQIMVEGLALAAFGMMKAQMPNEPLIQDITGRIMQDESRHVAFGVLSLENIYRYELTEAELREREEFVIEATHLMRDRLLMEQVFERMGWDVPMWVGWAKRTPFMLAFRQMLFSKIVPNLKRLGLLTPRVREEYGKIGLLQFESLKDSTEDPEVLPPEELVALIASIQAGAAAFD